MSQKAQKKNHEALLHFELGVKFATDELFGGMCLKKILYSYLSDYQLYEAEAILTRTSSIDRYLLVWQQTVDGCLAVIRQQYEVAIVFLSKAIVTVEKSIPNAIKQQIGLQARN